MTGTLLDFYYPFDSVAGSPQVVTEAQWRRMMNSKPGNSAGIMRGVGSEMKVIQRAAGANKSVDVGTGDLDIRGHYGYNTAVVNLGIADNASGNPRIDVIVARADFVNNDIVLDVLTGATAVSPTPPALTQNSVMHEISLAQIAVAAGFTSIVTANITDTREWRNAVRWLKEWAISGTQATPSGATNYIIPGHVRVEGGFTACIDSVLGEIRGGTSATVKAQSGAGLTGALGDVTGLTGIVLGTTPTETKLAASTAEVAITDKSRLAIVITAISSSPDNMLGHVGGWKWPTPLTA